MVKTVLGSLLVHLNTIFSRCIFMRCKLSVHDNVIEGESGRDLLLMVSK